MPKLRFYSSVFLGFLKNTFARESDYRGNLIAEIIDSLLNIFVNVYFFKIIFLNTSTIAGWSSEEILVLVAVTQLITSILYMLFMNNLPRIQSYVLRGDFDYILLKPCDSQFYISFRYFYFGAIPSVIFSIILLVYAAGKVETNISFFNIVYTVLAVIAAVTICYAIWFMIMLLSIIFIKIGAMHELFLSSLKFLEYPKDVYKGLVRIIMLFVIPLATVSNIPAECLLGNNSLFEIIQMLLLVVWFMIISRVCYLFVLKKYTSASS